MEYLTPATTLAKTFYSVAAERFTTQILSRSEKHPCLFSKDWIRDVRWPFQGFRVVKLQGYVIPQPSYPGTMYARYLKELAEKSRPLFLCHFYNIYFSHWWAIDSETERLLEGRELEFYRREGDAEELLRSSML